MRYFLLIVLLSQMVLPSSGQLSFGGSPASFDFLKKAAIQIPVIDMEPVDNTQLITEEHQDINNLKKYHFAKSFLVDISPEQSGTWITEGDMKIWRVGLRSRGAWSLNLIFDKMILPQGASLFIYNLDHSKVLGAFTSGSEQSSGHFATYPLAGDELIVEYNEPTSATVSGQLHILKINHDYKNAFGSRPLGESGLCNMDVYCPDAEPFLNEKQAVVCLLINGETLCTGTLLNNTSQDKTPYLLTAGHCINNQIDAQHTVFCFNYESPACGDGKNGKSSINGYVDQTLTGAILKAQSDSLDFSLVQLETPPPATFRPYYAGWNRSSSIPTSSTSITHPSGDVKKLTRDDNAPTIGSFTSDFKLNSFWIIGKWEIGSTEGGSSGGPLFNQHRLVIGTLTGGSSTCGDPTNDIFAMFNKQWDFDKSTTKQLKFWLDPINSNATEIPGLYPYNDTNSCTLFTNTLVGEIDTLYRISNKSSGYISGHNMLKLSGYAEKFTKTTQTTLSAIALGVAKVSSILANKNSKIVIKVYDEVTATGLPGNEIIAMDVPFSLMSSKKMNYIELPTPLILSNHYFIGYDINYSNATDTFALYTTPNRTLTSKNYAFAKVNNGWKPFYSIPEFGISTSLLINTTSCENTLAANSDPTIPDNVAIYNKNNIRIKQNLGLNDFLLLENSGDEIKDATINLYDIIGRKLYGTQKDLPKDSPVNVSPGHLATGLYFLTVETLTNRQVIKFQVNYPR